MPDISLEKLAEEFEKFKAEKKTKHYPKHLKERALEFAGEGVPVKRLCEKLGIHVTTFCYWRRAAQKPIPFAKAKVVETEVVSSLTVVTGIPIEDLGSVIKQLR